MYFSRRCN